MKPGFNHKAQPGGFCEGVFFLVLFGFYKSDNLSLK